MLPIIEAIIAAMTTQALLTGIYLVSFFVCLRWLVISDDGESLRRAINWPMLIITVILFAFSVVDFSLSLQSTFLASQGIESLLYAGTITDFIETLTSIITDAVLIYRCWVIYNKSWRITVLPALLLLYNISSLVAMTFLNCTNLTSRSGSLFVRILAIRATFYACTIIITIYATSAIILRISRESISVKRFWFTIRVIAESGLLYTLTSIVTFCVLLLQNQEPLFIATAINFPVAGIAYNLILIRMAQSRAKPRNELPSFINYPAVQRGSP